MIPYRGFLQNCTNDSLTKTVSASVLIFLGTTYCPKYCFKTSLTFSFSGDVKLLHLVSLKKSFENYFGSFFSHFGNGRQSQLLLLRFAHLLPIFSLFAFAITCISSSHFTLGTVRIIELDLKPHDNCPATKCLLSLLGLNLGRVGHKEGDI